MCAGDAITGFKYVSKRHSVDQNCGEKRSFGLLHHVTADGDFEYPRRCSPRSFPAPKILHSASQIQNDIMEKELQTAWCKEFAHKKGFAPASGKLAFRERLIFALWHASVPAPPLRLSSEEPGADREAHPARHAGCGIGGAPEKLLFGIGIAFSIGGALQEVRARPLCVWLANPEGTSDQWRRSKCSRRWRLRTCDEGRAFVRPRAEERNWCHQLSQFAVKSFTYLRRLLTLAAPGGLNRFSQWLLRISASQSHAVYIFGSCTKVSEDNYVAQE